MKTLKSKRLILRSWYETDAAEMFEFFKNESVKDCGWEVHNTIEDSIKCIKDIIKGEDSWAITLKETGKVIGWIALGGIHTSKHYKDIEIVISDDYKNNGYATETIKLILEYGFNDLGLLVIAINCYGYNENSKSVIKKCGFTHEGTLRKYYTNLADSVRYSMLKEEWETKNKGDI